MLEAQDRRLLLDALRPPDGYDLDCAIGTTYTVDLVALLTAPLGFTLFELSEAPQGKLNETDVLVLLKAIRKYADRIALFCQAGRIAPPARRHPLFASLEHSVVEVNAPNDAGVFHPKIWLLRFTAPQDVVRYRLLCLSRNLTFDQCWDTILVLDGELQDRRNAIGANHPIGEFVEALPDLALWQPVTPRVRGIVRTISREVRKVAFEVPEPFHLAEYWPTGLRTSRSLPFDERCERMLVVSPFLSAEALARITEEGRNHVLISRLDTLRELSKKQLAPFRRVFALNPGAAVDLEQDVQACDPAIPSTGLHAKLFVADQGWDASVWTGSMNATNAGTRLNVEFLVQLVGPKSKCGVDAFLAQTKGNVSLRDLLEPYTPEEQPVLPDAMQQRLEDRLEQIRRELSRGLWTSAVETTDDAQVFRVRLTGENVFVPDDASIHCWPCTVESSAGQTLQQENEDAVCVFPAISLEGLSAFVVFDVTVTEGNQRAQCTFVLNTRLEGAPPSRQDALLRIMLRDRRHVLRFLLLLLNDTTIDLGDALPATSDVAGASWSSTPFMSEALLEPLVRALEREPTRLDQIDALFQDLKASGNGSDLLPPGLHEIWEPIWEARKQLK